MLVRQKEVNLAVFQTNNFWIPELLSRGKLTSLCTLLAHLNMKHHD